MPTVMRRVRRLPQNPAHAIREEEMAVEVPGDEAPGGASQNLRHRFRPLARARTAAALAALDYLGQLAVRSRYHYSDEEAQAILDVLGEKMEELISAFARGTGNKPAFLFPDEKRGAQ